MVRRVRRRGYGKDAERSHGEQLRRLTRRRQSVRRWIQSGAANGDRRRTLAPASHAGGRWFDPSCAHLPKALQTRLIRDYSCLSAGNVQNSLEKKWKAGLEHRFGISTNRAAGRGAHTSEVAGSNPVCASSAWSERLSLTESRNLDSEDVPERVTFDLLQHVRR
jgi:hypothetical protein